MNYSASSTEDNPLENEFFYSMCKFLAIIIILGLVAVLIWYFFSQKKKSSGTTTSETTTSETTTSETTTSETTTSGTTTSGTTTSGTRTSGTTTSGTRTSGTTTSLTTTSGTTTSGTRTSGTTTSGTTTNPKITIKSSVNNLYDNEEGIGCLDKVWSPDEKPLLCMNQLLPQLNACCKSGVCKKRDTNDTWGACEKCKTDIDCNIVPYLVSEINDIKCETKHDHFGNLGKFCNNIKFDTDSTYLKSCTKDSDCIIPCNKKTGLCEYSTKLGTNEQCIISSSGNDPGISQNDPRYQQCLEQIKNLDNPCSNATTQIGLYKSCNEV